jgi:hypothetical protein
MPLRPDLYRRLCTRAHKCRFGEVRVMNEGVEMRATVEHDALYGKPQLNVIEPGEYLAINCPFCNDTRHRLWINHRWGLWDPRTQSKNLWLAICYNENCLNTYERLRALYNMVCDDITNGRRLTNDLVLKGTRPSRLAREMKPAGECIYPLHSLPSDHRAKAYLRSRGYDPDRLGRQLHVGYCGVAYSDFPLADDRIIIPITFGGIWVGWQARYIGEPPRGTPKYASMTGMKKREVLYNYDIAKAYPYVVICEGPTDVWRVGPAAVALLGKNLSTAQRHLIGTGWGGGAAVVLLDGDAQAEARRVHDALGGLVRDRVLVQLPEGKDPGDFAQEDLWRLIYEAARQQGVDLLGPRGKE